MRRLAASVYVANGSVVIEGHELNGRDAIAAGMRHSFAEFAILQLNAHGGVITVAGDTAQARWQTTELTISQTCAAVERHFRKLPG